jgi:hypothetical protein
MLLKPCIKKKIPILPVQPSNPKLTVMHISRNKVKFLIGFALLSVIFIYLRLKTFNHLLMWDEARNIISLRAFLTNNAADPFYGNYFLHPPLYMVFASMLFPFRAGLDIRLELLSLLFSYASLVIIYMLSARIGGMKYAFLNGLFLSIMPVSIAYDTWIKSDGLASCLGYLAIFLLLKRRFFWCAVALSFSLLAKENALFFILAVTVLLFILKEKKILKNIVIIYGAVFILTSWWYLCFSSMPKELFDIFLSADKNISTWGNSPLYYFKKLLPDMGLPVLIFYIFGFCYLLYLVLWKKQYRWSVPLIIVICVYVTGSFVIACKTPWLCLSATPALAMVAGGGVLFLLKIAKRSKLLLTVFALFFIFSIFGSFLFSYDKYHINSCPNGWSGANYSRKLALYLNRHTQSSERLMLTQFSYWGPPLCSMCPVFLYYCDGRSIYVIDGRDAANEIIKAIINNRISWFVINDSPNKHLNFHALVKGSINSVLERPAFIGCSYVWKTDNLWRGEDKKERR